MTTTETSCPELLKAKDLAQLLRVTPRAIWLWAGSGRLPEPIRLGRRAPRWRRSDIDLYIQCGADMQAYAAQRREEVQP